jgi:hypothetical protein
MMQHLAAKGTLSIKDVKLLNRQNASLQSEEKLAKIGSKDAIQILMQCE